MGRKAIIEPQSHTETGAIEFPSGWRLILASMRGLKLTLGGGARDDDESGEENLHEGDRDGGRRDRRDGGDDE
jgi:hypothetical protein